MTNNNPTDRTEVSTDTDAYQHTSIVSKDEVADEIQEWVDDARALAQEIGLDPYHVNYWVVDNDEMNALAAYDGFQRRYPHYRWAMKWDKQRKQDRYTGSRIFELVNNDDPANAFLQRSNTIADQKAVVTHVEAHSDFFANNRWFDDDPGGADMLAHHADRVESIVERDGVGREDVERLIDTVSCIEDTIDQHDHETTEDGDGASISEHVESIDVDDSIKEQLFDEDWIEAREDEIDEHTFEEDVVAFLAEHGGRYDEESEQRRELEDWEREVIEMLHEEAQYFAPQRMCKVMLEGHASFFETIMMADEGFADDDEFLNYADHHAKVLEAPGFNPYRIGREIWEHIENEANKREVLDKLLRVEGVTPKTFHSQVDISMVEDELDQPDSYSPAVRNFSLLRSENRDVLRSVSTSELDEQYRYMFETDRYETIFEALPDVDYSAGWDRIMEVRETHVDATFIGEFVTEEFIERNDYFAYDYNPKSGQYEVSSTDPMDVKKKLLLKFTNFGKPTILVEDDNYRNRGELLLAHQYNGVSLDTEQAKDVLERVYELWGRPVHLRTVVKESEAEEPNVRTGSVILQIEDREVVTEEYGMEISYDGEEFTEVELDADFVEYLAADEIDYEIRPEEWL
jgi:stage V sporulation protein R